MILRRLTMPLRIWKAIFCWDMCWRKNIYLLIAHQTEDYMPMTLACMKAAKKLIMETLEKEKGYGWWGNRENKDFYENTSLTIPSGYESKIQLTDESEDSRKWVDNGDGTKSFMMPAEEGTIV